MVVAVSAEAATNNNMQTEAFVAVAAEVKAAAIGHHRSSSNNKWQRSAGRSAHSAHHRPWARAAARWCTAKVSGGGGAQDCAPHLRAISKCI